MPAVSDNTTSRAIPGFSAFREPLITDAPIFHEIASQAEPSISEITFTNIYVWRHTAGYQLSMLNDNICILAGHGNESPFFLPPLGNNNLGDTVMELFNYLRDQGHPPVLSRVPEETVRAIVETIPGVIVEEDYDNADYIYLSSDLADLPGRKYHKKRNHISRFAQNYSYEYKRMTPDTLDMVRDFQKRWCKVRSCFSPLSPGLAAEHRAIMETLDNFEALGVTGGVILVEGRVEAFTIGEPLNHNTFVIHFEKGNPAYQGCYQTINQQFCDDVCRPYTYVNREQDLGEPGLRQAKRSYYPHHLLMKYNVRLPE